MDLRKTNLTIEFFSKYLNILNNFQKGTPWERAFSLHSATTDTAHVPWFYHCFATIDNFCLGFLQWLNKTKIQKNKKPRNQKKTRLHTPRGGVVAESWVVAFCFFLFLGVVFCFSWFWLCLAIVEKPSRNIDFSKRGTAPLKGGLDIWKCTLH